MSEIGDQYVYVMRMALDNNGTILDIPTILTDRTFGTKYLRRASYRPFWEEGFEKWDDRFRNDAIAPVLIGPKPGRRERDFWMRRQAGKSRLIT